MSDQISIDEMLKILLASEWRPTETRIKVFVQSVAAFRKKTGYITPKQEISLRKTWEVHQRRMDEEARGAIPAHIPDDYFIKTAERRKGHPRNNRPHNLTKADYDSLVGGTNSMP